MRTYIFRGYRVKAHNHAEAIHKLKLSMHYFGDRDEYRNNTDKPLCQSALLADVREASTAINDGKL